MTDVIKTAAKVISEMAVAKMPEGVKRKRDSQYSGVHHIHVDGEHVATISGDKARYRGAPSHAKEYTINNPGYASGHQWDHQTQKSINQYHPDHHTIQDRPHYSYVDGKSVTKMVPTVVPDTHDSMDSAIEAIVHTHRNNKEFGRGHDPRKRWEIAAAGTHDIKDHQEKNRQYHSAINAAETLGHSDIADQLRHHHDAYKASAAGTSLSKDRVHQLTHDARGYTAKEYNSQTREYEPKHPEYHAAATAALKAREAHHLY